MFGPGRPFFSTLFSVERLAEQEQWISSPATAVPGHHARPGFCIKIRLQTSRASLPIGSCRSACDSRNQSNNPLLPHDLLNNDYKLYIHYIITKLWLCYVQVSVSSLPRTDVIPYVHCGKCRFITHPKQNTDVGQQQQSQRPADSSLGEGLLDLPPAQLRLQRLRRSRSRSSSPSFESVRRLLHPSHRIASNDKSPSILTTPPLPSSGIKQSLVDDRMRIDCNRIGKHDCKCAKEEADVVDLKLPAVGHGDRWGHDLERGRRGGLDRECGGTGPAERGRSRRSRKDCFADQMMSSSSGGDFMKPETCPAHQTGKSVPTSDDKLRFQRSLNSAASLLFHTTTSTNGPASKPPLFGQRFPLNKFLRSPPLRMSSSPLLGSFEVPAPLYIS